MLVKVSLVAVVVAGLVWGVIPQVGLAADDSASAPGCVMCQTLPDGASLRNIYPWPYPCCVFGKY